MKISILGISNVTDYIIEKIGNQTEEILVYSEITDFDFELKNSSKKNITIVVDPNLKSNLEKISNESNKILILSNSDTFNSFAYHKIINTNESIMTIMLIQNLDLYEMYKSKNCRVISPFELEKSDFLYIVKE